MTEKPERPRTVEADTMDDYLLLLQRLDRLHAPVGRMSLRSLFHALVPEPYRLPVRVRLTAAMAPVTRRRAKSIISRSPLQLNLGSARARKEGWVNVDLVGCGADLTWDLAKALPLPDGSADAVFHEHLLEHMDLAAGVRLIRDSYRLLKIGGVLRVGVPDVRRYILSYVDGGEGLVQQLRPGRPTPLLALQEVFYRDGHKTTYDEATLKAICGAAGFRDGRVAAFGQSRLRHCPDSENRRAETLYFEATR